MTNAIILGIVISTVQGVIFLRATSGRSKLLFADRHVVEAAMGVAGVRRAALENIEEAADTWWRCGSSCASRTCSPGASAKDQKPRYDCA